jgi:vacuolar protein sorting-associated protein 35
MQLPLPQALPVVWSDASTVASDANARRYLENSSTLVSELRTSSLGPKQYYELYMAVFDALRHLSVYLRESHPVNHLADLYELVQYAGNIVPRLYLMVAVGTVYMAIEDAPVKEIMKDMMEMSRGIQHPIRGLFLRYYLSGQARDHLPTGTGDGPEGNLQDSISFILTNFVEMNKLWVRLQHQGHSREREKRTQERQELQLLVGSNLVRLSQLVDLDTYKNVILQPLLEQVVQCRDVLAQEYLLEGVFTGMHPDRPGANGDVFSNYSGLSRRIPSTHLRSTSLSHRTFKSPC